MHPAVVADPGGLLVLAGLVAGVHHDVDEILALDASALLLAEYLALRHEGAPERARSDFAITCHIVREWFPVRGLAIEAAIASLGDDVDADGTAALALAHTLRLPMITKNRDLVSREIPVLYC